MCYTCLTMVKAAKKRAGKTETVTISLSREDAAAFRRHAEKNHEGNLSRAFAEMTEYLRRLEGMDRLHEWLGHPIVAQERLDEIEAEQFGPQVKRSKRGRAA